MFKNYWTIAFRNLWKNKVNTIINISGLSLGIACSLIIYICVKYELSFDSSHSHSDRIYRVVEQHRSTNLVQYWNTTAYPLANALRRDFPELSVTQTAGPLSYMVSVDNRNGDSRRFQEDRVLFADSNYLSVFDFKAVAGKEGSHGLWLAGDPRTAFQNPNAVLLTQSLAERYFPGKGPGELIGRTMKLANTYPVTITGVLKDPPSNTNLLFTLLVNYSLFASNNTWKAANWSGNYDGTTFVELPPAVNAAEIDQRLISFKKKYLNAEDDRNITWLLQPLSDIHNNTLYGSSPGYSYVTGRATLWCLAALGAFLLFIASFNFINLTTARSVKRSKEVGIRKTIGGTRIQLFFQFMTEMVFITGIAAVLALVVLNPALHFINQQLFIIRMNLQPEVSVLVFTVLLVLLLALLAGVYPSLVLSAYNPLTALKNKLTVTSRTGVTLRQGLIVLQFGIAFFLIVGTVVISSQMRYLLHKDLGWAREAVLTVNIPSSDASKLEVFRQKLLLDPAIKKVSYANGAPIATLNRYGTSFRLSAEPEASKRAGEMKEVDLDYLDLYGLTMVAGNWLSQSNKTTDHFNGVVVNETLVAQLGLQPATAIGQRLTINEGTAPIIGVIKDFNNNSLQQKIKPCVLFYQGTDLFAEAGIKLQSNNGQFLNLAVTLGRIEKDWKESFPGGIFKPVLLEDQLALNYITESMISEAFRLFAAIAIFVSCMGLFGLVVFASEQRTKEFGIRKVLGASVGSILSLLASDLLRLIGIAMLVSAPFAWWVMNMWLDNYAYRIPLSGWLFLVAALTATGIALATISVQALRAAFANPVRSLRAE